MYGAIWEKGEKQFTHLKKVFKAINDVQHNYNWLITDCECYPSDDEIGEQLISKYRLDEQLRGKYTWIDGQTLSKYVYDLDFQWIWGVLSAFDKKVDLNDVLKYPLPYADENETIWTDVLKAQHPMACIEIIAFDAAYMKILSKDKKIIDDFLNGLPSAEQL